MNLEDYIIKGLAYNLQLWSDFVWLFGFKVPRNHTRSVTHSDYEKRNVQNAFRAMQHETTNIVLILKTFTKNV